MDSSYRSPSNNNNNQQQQFLNNNSRSASKTSNNNSNNAIIMADQQNAINTRDTISTLHEAAEAFDLVSNRAQRCSLQIATWKSHENQVRKFLVDRVLPHADEALRDREVSSQKREEEYGSAMLRLKGVQLPAGSPPRSSVINSSSSNSYGGSPSGSRKFNGSGAMKATDDPELASALSTLKALTSKYGKKSDGSP